MKNYYEILEVNPKASKEIIKKVYKIHIKNNHPDLVQGKQKEEAEERIKKINEAYETIIDDFKRKDYDLQLENNEQSSILAEENEYLKQVIEQKNEIIGNLVSTYNGTGRANDYLQNQDLNNRYDDEYNGEYEANQTTESYDYIKEFKTLRSSILNFLFIVVVAGVIILKITGVNIFAVFWNVLKNIF